MKGGSFDVIKEQLKEEKVCMCQPHDASNQSKNNSDDCFPRMFKRKPYDKHY